MLTIRPAVLADLDGITEIYNNAILETVATFDTEPKTRREQEAWLAGHGGRYPVLVAEETGITAGWTFIYCRKYSKSKRAPFYWSPLLKHLR